MDQRHVPWTKLHVAPGEILGNVVTRLLIKATLDCTQHVTERVAKLTSLNSSVK